jgi:hypothetical protein
MSKQELLTKLQKQYPSVTLKAGENFYWSPTEKTVYYTENMNDNESTWALLHETGHALLKHTKYETDIELVFMEMEAWEEAKKIADLLNEGVADQAINIDEDHVQDCLDSYRDWLHKRSLCPDCSLAGIQIEQKMYTCVFCFKRWSVTSERFCRPYRRRQELNSE